MASQVVFSKPADRLIVALDLKPNVSEKYVQVKERALRLLDTLAPTQVFIKVNSLLRGDYTLIDEIHARDLRAFADLKLYDISETLATDGVFLREKKPEILTVACLSGVSSMQALKATLPDTEILGVTVLTSLGDNDTKAMFVCSTERAVMRIAQLAQKGGIDGLIASAYEATALRRGFGMMFTLNTPAIRPVWAIVPGDDQNPDRIMTPAKAIQAGADRVIIGRPIMQADDPLVAVMRTLEEINSVI